MTGNDLSGAPQPRAPRTLCDGHRLALVAVLATAFLVFGLAVTGPEESWEGMIAILGARDTLITDYVELGGVGGAFLNAGLLTLAAVSIFRLSGAQVGGSALACLLMVLGAALFGKNLVNVWPILIGVELHARRTRTSFAAHAVTAFFGCALSPVVSELLFSSALPFWQSLPLSLGAGIAIGFVLPPAAAQLYHAHGGYSLYNMGFTAGVIGSVLVAVLLFYGFVPRPVFIWAEDQTWVLAPFLLASFAAMAAAGPLTDRGALRRYRALLREPGRAPSDFCALHGDGATLLNCGILGLVSTGYVLAVGGVLNGPVTGAILSVVGFGCFGKHLGNVLPVMAGVWLMSHLGGQSPARPELLLAALFGTALAPISGGFGWRWGILAGALHAAVAQSAGQLLGGLSLYGNGFAAGFVAAVLAPTARAMAESRRR
ncbi:DUF1576 domain-containing protein [Poseidonocella sp. HB161398]|uniref:DUF1576 domain-containing protein n=1 Tax=Poseidonocella sp. HB161398 TaxID=2320855 RepID=UPI0011089A2A|nr:DUF1576 domain-containing protein [Poseidonocella sp. HB161398]